eukprot:c5659_g1_i4.p1 GENE.c5659_g1_i4~~c5659_g1_i4.p1  ORF type:complete len:275 (+),score=62.70 c5659_g1_i4:580-1404(+)
MQDHCGVIKLIDLSNAIREVDKAAYETDFEVQSLWYRAPEVALGAKLDVKMDMWSLGCVLLELASGVRVFECKGIRQLLSAIMDLVGQLPSKFSSALNYGRYFSPNHTLLGTDPEKAHQTLSRFHRKRSIAAWLNTRGCQVAACDESFIDMISVMLDPDPSARVSPEQALSHRFFHRTSPLYLIPKLGLAAPFRVAAQPIHFERLDLKKDDFTPKTTQLERLAIQTAQSNASCKCNSESPQPTKDHNKRKRTEIDFTTDLDSVTTDHDDSVLLL